MPRDRRRWRLVQPYPNPNPNPNPNPIPNPNPNPNQVDALAKWLGTHQEGLSKLVQVQNQLLDDLAVLQQLNG